MKNQKTINWYREKLKQQQKEINVQKDIYKGIEYEMHDKFYKFGKCCCCNYPLKDTIEDKIHAEHFDICYACCTKCGFHKEHSEIAKEYE